MTNPLVRQRDDAYFTAKEAKALIGKRFRVTKELYWTVPVGSIFTVTGSFSHGPGMGRGIKVVSERPGFARCDDELAMSKSSMERMELEELQP